MTSNLHLLSRDQAHDTPTHQVLLGGHSPPGSRVTLTGRDVTQRDVRVGVAWLTRVPADASRRRHWFQFKRQTRVARRFVTCRWHLVTRMSRETVCQPAKRPSLAGSDSNRISCNNRFWKALFTIITVDTNTKQYELNQTKKEHDVCRTDYKLQQQFDYLYSPEWWNQ